MESFKGFLKTQVCYIHWFSSICVLSKTLKDQQLSHHLSITLQLFMIHFRTILASTISSPWLTTPLVIAAVAAIEYLITFENNIDNAYIYIYIYTHTLTNVM